MAVARRATPSDIAFAPKVISSSLSTSSLCSDAERTHQPTLSQCRFQSDADPSPKESPLRGNSIVIRFKIFTPSPILGYGYDVSEFWSTVETYRPAAIILDGGSTDPGLYMLGSGKTICSRTSCMRDLEPVLEACAKYDIKLLSGSAGGAETNEQVDFLVDIIKELLHAKGYSFKIATIKFNDDRGVVISKLQAGNFQPCGSALELRIDDISTASSIVTQMGAEPFMRALDEDADIIVSGRSYDPASFAAFSMPRGVRRDPAWHMGKIVECGDLCAVPKGRSMLATVYENSFE